MEEGAPAGAAPLAVANCRIPNTPRAVEFMDRRLGVDPRRRRSGGSGADDGLVSTLSCPKGGCVIEGITAIGYAQPRFPSGGGTTSGTSCAMVGCGTWDASYEYYSYSDYSPEPDPGTPGEPCNTGDAFLDDPVVNQGFRRAVAGEQPQRQSHRANGESGLGRQNSVGLPHSGVCHGQFLWLGW
ncbi:MAG TPA: hypothetical protein VF625_06510 [Longimicrobium sp.]|jgi:hypothetical protein